METNGRNSCTGNSRLVNIKYFFIKDCVDENGSQDRILSGWFHASEFFTKPLQGQLIHKFMNVIMVYAHISTMNIKQF